MTRWKLTCSYMGGTASETVSEAELADVWTFVQLGEVIDKCAGGHFEDADGPTNRLFAWKEGQATETGCGPWWSGFEDTTVTFCDGLLARAGLPDLVRGESLDATFNIDGPNADALDILDRAEWKLES